MNLLPGVALGRKSWFHEHIVQSSLIQTSLWEGRGLLVCRFCCRYALHFQFCSVVPSSSKLRTGHQMARSCHPAVSLLFARCPPWPRRGPLPSPGMYAGHALLISEALMWAGNVFYLRHLFFFFFPLWSSFSKTRWNPRYKLEIGGKWNCGEFQLSFSLLCVNWVNFWIALIHKLISSYRGQAIPSDGH